MGKPFKSELLRLEDTYVWVEELNLEPLKLILKNLTGPVYLVGSGGSLSACYFGVYLYEQMGIFAKAITPLELHSLRNTLHNANVIFISASGKNTDILFGFKTAVLSEPKQIVSICMREESKLTELSKEYTLSKIYEYKLPVGKDGFLATNSLIGYFSILSKTLGENYNPLDFSKYSLDTDIERFVNGLESSTAITVLYNGLSKPVAFDIESKSIEAALFPILLSDYRNFGHGRHHWFAKKKGNAAVIALTNPNDLFLANKTLDTLPDYVSKLLLQTDRTDPSGTLDLLIQSFYAIEKFGTSLGIDPGRPGVPAFGRKLYNLKYATALAKTEDNRELSLKARTAISRKVNEPLVKLTSEEIKQWNLAYETFIKKLNKAEFGAIVLDYDGTVCSADRKFDGPNDAMSAILNKILSKGFFIALATGRGKSVRMDLQKIIDKKYWSQILIGYYNGSDIGYLNDDSIPNTNTAIHPVLKRLDLLIEDKLYHDVERSLRPNQLTIEFGKSNSTFEMKESIMHTVKTSECNDVQILQSSHSIDIVPEKYSKTDIFEPLVNLLQTNGKSTDLLCIGDKGKWPGNDFHLLSSPNSLSVSEVSSNKDSCWNIAPVGVSHTDATLKYLSWLKFDSSKMKLKISK